MTTVVVLAKEPVPGRVKTRLCPPCSPEQAAELAAAALADTLDAVDASTCAGRVLAFDGRPDRWQRSGWSVRPQVGGDLGRRLDASIAAVDGPVLVVGMDTPQLTPMLVDHACAQLTDPDVDAVLGPAVDGGYWAIGFRRAPRGAFTGVPMSRVDTGWRQRVRLGDLGLRVADLDRLRDVDTFADARVVAQLVPHTAFARSFNDCVGAA
jgi:rSAM/selenodomain-associated transferase 1